jgi:hypothetical protein
MRTTFELKIAAVNITEAKELAIREVGSFLEIPDEEVLDSVNLEIKVSYPEGKTLTEILDNMDSSKLVVTVYGSVKQSVTKPFGF